MPIGTLWRMDNHDIIRDLEEYSSKAGVAVSTVCRNATGNPRLYDRLKRRIDRTQADVDALRKYMIENPSVVAPEQEAS